MAGERANDREAHIHQGAHKSHPGTRASSRRSQAGSDGRWRWWWNHERSQLSETTRQVGGHDEAILLRITQGPARRA